MGKEQRRTRRKKSIRRKIFGTAEKPRMSVHKSLKNINVQLVDDIQNKTICSLSSLSPKIKGEKTAKTRKNVNFAAEIGAEIAKIAQEKGIKKVVFDRSGYRYQGAVKAVADAARKGGLEF